MNYEAMKRHERLKITALSINLKKLREEKEWQIKSKESKKKKIKTEK